MTPEHDVGPPKSRGLGLAEAPGVAPLPVTRSILSGEVLAAEIIDGYPLHAPVACQLLGHGLHDTYLLATREGRYLARLSRAGWRSPSDISYELDLAAHLAARGLAVPRPVSARDGQWIRSLQAPEGARHLVLFAHAESRPLAWEDEADCYLAGRLAATFHTGSDDFASRHDRFTLDSGNLIDTPLAAIRPFLSHRPDDWNYLQGLAAELRKRVDEAASAGLDWGVCHGDLGGRSICVTDNQVPGVIDLDASGLGWRAHDLAAVHWYRKGAWECFLKGYAETRPVTGADLAAVPLFHAVRHLSMLGVTARNAGSEGVWRMHLGLDRELSFFREWQAEYLQGNGGFTQPVQAEDAAKGTAGLARRPKERALLAEAAARPHAMLAGRQRTPLSPGPASLGQGALTPAGAGALQSVVHAIISAEAVLAAAERAYALDGPLTCELWRAGLNDTYLLSAGGAPHIARVYGVRRSTSDIAYELELLAHLAAKGVAVSAPIPGKDGAVMYPLHALEGRRYLVLFTFAEGKTLSRASEEHQYLAGRMAAAIHAASDDFSSLFDRPRLDLGFLTDRPLAAIRPLLTHHPEDQNFLEGLAAELHTRVEEAARGGLDWGACHGDFEVKNMHLGADRRLTTFDFDMCGPGWRLYDLAPAYGSAMRQKKPAIWDSFLRGYNQTRTLTTADLASLPVFYALRYLTMLGAFAGNVSEWGTSSVSLRPWLTFFHQWEAEHLRDK